MFKKKSLQEDARLSHQPSLQEECSTINFNMIPRKVELCVKPLLIYFTSRWLTGG